MLYNTDYALAYVQDEGIYSFTYFNPTITAFGLQKKDPFHRHGPIFKDEYTVQYVSSGEGTYKLNNVNYHVKAGDLFYLPKNKPVFYSAKSENPYEYYWLAFDGDGVENFLKQLGLTENNPVISYNDEKITHSLKTIGDYLLEGNDVGFLNANGEIYKLFALLLSLSDGKNVERERYESTYVNQAILYIRNNFYDGDLNVTKIAKAIGLSRNYFSVIFTKIIGVTPVDYLMCYRIDQAKQLLKIGSSITETAFSVGFNSTANFSFQFKNVTGVSPIKYKKQPN